MAVAALAQPANTTHRIVAARSACYCHCSCSCCSNKPRIRCRVTRKWRVTIDSLPTMLSVVSPIPRNHENHPPSKRTGFASSSPCRPFFFFSALSSWRLVFVVSRDSIDGSIATFDETWCVIERRRNVTITVAGSAVRLGVSRPVEGDNPPIFALITRTMKCTRLSL